MHEDKNSMVNNVVVAVKNVGGPVPSLDCDCSPPPEFHLPPPPLPPSLEDENCTPEGLHPLETCQTILVVDAQNRHTPVLPSIAVIITCSSILVVMVMIAALLLWKRKCKSRHLLSCKSSPCQHPRDSSATNGSVIYEDLTLARPRTLHSHVPPIELIDVQYGSKTPLGFPLLGGASVFVCAPPPPRTPPTPPPRTQPAHRDLYNPVYEELSLPRSQQGSACSSNSSECCQASLSSLRHGNNCSEDEAAFAEDELSIGENTPSLPTVQVNHHSPTSSSSEEEQQIRHIEDAIIPCRPIKTDVCLHRPSSGVTVSDQENVATRRPRSLDRRARGRRRLDAGFHEDFIFHTNKGELLRRSLLNGFPTAPTNRRVGTVFVQQQHHIPSVTGGLQIISPNIHHYTATLHHPSNIRSNSAIRTGSQDSCGSDSGFSNATTTGNNNHNNNNIPPSRFPTKLHSVDGLARLEVLGLGGSINNSVPLSLRKRQRACDVIEDDGHEIRPLYSVS